MLLAICDRFGCLPSAARREDASVLRLLRIEALGKPRHAKGGEPGAGW